MNNYTMQTFLFLEWAGNKANDVYVYVYMDMDMHLLVFLNCGCLIINSRRACAARVTVVGFVCVCLSVKSHLTSGASVRPEINVTYLTDNDCQTICEIFSETAPLQRSSTPSVVWPYVQWAIFKAHALTNEACQLAVCARV